MKHDRVVHAAIEFLILAVDRVVHVGPGGEISREVRRLQWSAFNVPLMWAAAANDQECAILEWLNQLTESFWLKPFLFKAALLSRVRLFCLVCAVLVLPLGLPSVRENGLHRWGVIGRGSK